MRCLLRHNNLINCRARLWKRLLNSPLPFIKCVIKCVRIYKVIQDHIEIKYTLFHEPLKFRIISKYLWRATKPVYWNPVTLTVWYMLRITDLRQMIHTGFRASWSTYRRFKLLRPLSLSVSLFLSLVPLPFGFTFSWNPETLVFICVSFIST